MADDKTQNETTRDRGNPWTSWPFITGAVVVAVIALMGAGLAISSLLERPSPPVAGPPAASPPPPTVTSSGAEASICGLTAHEASGTITRAPEAEWSLVGTTAAPRNETSGPGLVEESGYRHCYARTAEGAVFAAANFAAMGSDPGLMTDVARGSVVEGAGRDVLMKQPVATSGGGVRVQIVGVRVLAYNDKKAQVDIAVRTSNGSLGGQVFDLLWDGGDWKMEVTSNGDLLTRATQLRDLSSYVMWGGA